MKVSQTTQFSKDLKKQQKRGKDLSKLIGTIDLLVSNGALPDKFRDHPLTGNWKGWRDCHIEPDWLLIYTLTENDSHVRFERTGTHSDLFR